MAFLIPHFFFPQIPFKIQCWMTFVLPSSKLFSGHLESDDSGLHYLLSTYRYSVSYTKRPFQYPQSRFLPLRNYKLKRLINF